MVKKITLLVCSKALTSCCTGAACLSAFNHRTGGFQQYRKEDLELTAFFLCNDCESDMESDAGMEEKTERILKIHPDAVHLGVCTLREDGTRCEQVKKLIRIFQQNGIPVINGTHENKRLHDIGMPVQEC